MRPLSATSVPQLAVGLPQEADVEALRRLGLVDEQILSVVLIACTFNFMTRLADGLGVEVDHGRQEAVERWLTGPAGQQDWLVKPKA